VFNENHDYVNVGEGERDALAREEVRGYGAVGLEGGSRRVRASEMVV